MRNKIQTDLCLLSITSRRLSIPTLPSRLSERSLLRRANDLLIFKNTNTSKSSGMIYSVTSTIGYTMFTANERQSWTDSHDYYFEYLIIHFDYLIIQFDYLIIG